MDFAPVSSAATTPMDEDEVVKSRSSSPTPSLGNNVEMFDLSDLTDNISVASFGEAAGSNTSESSHMSSNLLKLDTKGFIGIFERFPLAIKIILLVLCSAVGLAALSAFALALSSIMLQNATKASKYISQGRHLASAMQAIQAERRDGRTMLQGDGTSLQVDYLKAIPVTEAAISAMIDAVSQDLGVYGDAFTDFTTRRKDLDSLRAKTTARTLSVFDLVTGYHEVIQTLLVMLHKCNGVFEYDYDMSSISLFGEYNEAIKVIFSTGGIMLRDPSTRSEMLPILIKYEGERIVTERMILSAGAQSVVEQFKGLIATSAVKALVDTTIQELLERPGNYTYNVDEFTTAMLTYTRLYDLASSRLFAADIQQYTDQLSNSSIGIIVAVVMVVLFFSVFSISNAILFARSIIGPWQRLNAVQEATISKFVPKGFLSLMGWKSISQAALGKCQEKEVTIAIVSGYIDKFNSNYFVAIFPKDKKAMKAALEIQQSMANFNKMQATFSVITRITLATGKNIMGTIGENERMESTSISMLMRVALRLQKVAKRANASILTTKESLSKLPNPKVIHHRYIGNIKMKSEALGSCELVEILSFSDPVKIKTKDAFSKAVRCLQVCRFHDALPVFEALAQSNPSDLLAVKYRDITKQYITENVKRLTEITASQVLQVPALRGVLEQQCIQEHSTENFNLWNKIQSFKECQSAEERREIATTICNEFLQLEGKQAVNLSEEQVAAVKRVVENTSTLLTPLLFVEIEAQTEHLMTDTVKRLKHQQQFKLEFLNSSLAYKLEELDIL